MNFPWGSLLLNHQWARAGRQHLPGFVIEFIFVKGEREGGKRLAEKKLKLMKGCTKRKKENIDLAVMAIDKHGEE